MLITNETIIEIGIDKKQIPLVRLGFVIENLRFK